MTKQKIEIEVDIPDWCEFVRYGIPADGDLSISSTGDVIELRAPSAVPRVIVREAWQWPPWLKADYIARAKVEKWYAYKIKPTIGSSAWFTHDGEVCCLSNGMFDFTPPPCDDWTQSLRVRPGVEQKETAK